LSPTSRQTSANRAIGVAQQGRRALEPAGQQVAVWGLAEGAAELAAEVGAGEPRGRGHLLDPERLRVAGVGEVLGTQQVPGGAGRTPIIFRV